MKKFTFNVVRTVDQYGVIDIEAETVLEARDLFRDNPEYYEDIEYGPPDHGLELLDLIETQDLETL